MNPLLSFINRLLPFATPGTPLLQDLTHLAVICVVLYYAPQIQEHLRNPQANHDAQDTTQPEPVPEPAPQPEPIDFEPEAPLPEQEVEIRAPEPAHQEVLFDGAPGPAADRANFADQRNASTKKAKSLARKDQRRAYNEWLRSEGDRQRAIDAEGAEERERVLVAERERRRAVEVAVEAKRLEERRKVKQKMEEERLEEIRRREMAIRIVREELEVRKMCDLFKVARQVGGDVDEEWVEKILAAGGVLGRKGEVLTMVTRMGWAVSVSAEDMARLYGAAVEDETVMEDGGVEYERLGSILESTILT